MMGKTEMNELPPCLIFIDKEGRWYHKGAEMIHRDFIRLFYQHMELDSQGQYVISWQGQRCWVHAYPVTEQTVPLYQQGRNLDP